MSSGAANRVSGKPRLGAFDFEPDSVANGYRVRRRATLQPHLAAEDGREGLPLREAAQQEMTAGILYNYGLVRIHFTLPVRLLTNSFRASSFSAPSPIPATASIAFLE